ncbi:hypothetical protein [Novosphingobium sp.]|uniref:hypothetical protein n=1 Tax=Novosphingobium sp. TaxID=1874826 RepID=UPI0038B8C3CE
MIEYELQGILITLKQFVQATHQIARSAAHPRFNNLPNGSKDQTYQKENQNKTNADVKNCRAEHADSPRQFVKRISTNRHFSTLKLRLVLGGVDKFHEA